MSFRCIHISDIHFRGLSRHDEYRESFEHFFNKAKKLKPDIIFVGGDIVHSKTQGISPELIDILNWWFTELANIAPTHIILGNHDGLILNKDRQDAISPIITALNNPNLHLYKKSGTYPIGIEGYNWGVFSCFDEENWENVKPVPGEINIALFHGAVEGSITDIDWSIEGDINVEFFKDWDFAFLGDIHKLQYLNESKTVAYPGSTIQQNYGEDPGKGFLFWEIENKESFASTFHEIPHGMPFVTIDWAGDVQSTLDEAEFAPDGARFRVRTTSPISQIDIKHLHAALKEFKSASEIVYKHDHDFVPNVVNAGGAFFQKEDLRDSKTHIKLMREYYKELDLTNDEWKNLEDLVHVYINQLAHNDAARNIKWSIKRLEFDNMFSYGKGNVIDFTKLGGITGIFGKNRSGKSSIPGTIMYALYNTTDRGAIKNLHIINSRKGFCRVNVIVNVNGQDYKIERQSVKHETRAGKLHAVTHLNIFAMDEQGDTIQDLTEEQRRESEKVLRKLLGTSDDFLLTSLASQGEMNSFIKHRATQRKAILTNFLDLNVFEKMSELAKEDSAEIKALIKNAPDREWDTIILEKKTEKLRKSKDRNVTDTELSRLRLRLQELNISLATHKDKDLVTIEDVREQEKKIHEAELEDQSLKQSLDEKIIELSDIKEKLKKIRDVKSQFPIEELKEKLGAQQDLEKSIIGIQHLCDKEKTLLKNQEKSIQKLSEVPCGDKFPTCKFIKDSHKNSKLITDQIEKVNCLLDQLKVTKKSLKVLKHENLEGKIAKYDSIIHQESKFKVSLSRSTMILHELRTKLSSLGAIIDESINTLNDMRTRVSINEKATEINQLKKSVNELMTQINKLDSNRMSLSESIGLLTRDIDKLKEEQEKYRGLLARWKTYDLFMSAVSKKGIPLQIISSQLPHINNEIAKILQDVVGFTVELEADPGSNDMDVYINYGDSRRIIECGSGMEKMMASLAIRVALINISSLPKSDILVIDEGFGALDEMNVEACNKLLESLKKWFKNILVISHVDAVKDAVDNVLDISRKNKDARIFYE